MSIFIYLFNTFMMWLIDKLARDSAITSKINCDTTPMMK